MSFSNLLNGKSLGLVGLGEQMCKRHLPVFAGLEIIPGCVYDENQQAIEKFKKYFIKNYPEKTLPVLAKNFEELLDKSEIIDFVVPPSMHFLLLSKAIEQGRKFIVEKPFCLSWPEADYLYDRIREKHIAAAYLENWIFDPVIYNIMALISKNEIGQIQRIDIQFPNAGPTIYPEQSEWRTSQGQGGALLDWGSHAIGLGLYISGITSEIIQVNTFELKRSNRLLGAGVFVNGNVEDIAQFEMLLKTPDHRLISCNIDCSWQSPWMYSPGYKYRVIRIDGHRGSIEAWVENTQEGRNYELSIESSSDVKRYINLGTLKRYDPTKDAIINSIKSINYYSGNHPESDIHFATRIQLVISALHLSAKRNRSVAPEECQEWLNAYKNTGLKANEIWEHALKQLYSQQ